MNLCVACGHDFASVRAFDRHRTGVHEYTLSEGLRFEPPVEDGRRCMDAREMSAAGLVLDGRGRWTVSADRDHARRRFSDVPVTRETRREAA